MGSTLLVKKNVKNMMSDNFFIYTTMFIIWYISTNNFFYERDEVLLCWALKESDVDMGDVPLQSCAVPVAHIIGFPITLFILRISYNVET